jgi:hypothetical protein
MKGSTVLVRDGQERRLEGKGTYTGMKHGDLVKVTVGGGAGSATRSSATSARCGTTSPSTASSPSRERASATAS